MLGFSRETLLYPTTSLRVKRFPGGVVRKFKVGRSMTLGFAALPPACAVRLSLTEDWCLNQVPAALPLRRA